MRRPTSRRWAVAFGGLAVILILATVIFILRAPRRGAWTCVTTNSIAVVHQYETLLHRRLRCAVMFIDAAPTWADWEHPWFISDRSNNPSLDWIDWYDRGRTHRHLVITQTLIPSDLRGGDWLAQGANGAYEDYARTFARTLVAEGMGSVIIRVAHEANGTWYADSIPANPVGDAEWVKFWRNTVDAMRSVPGAHFRFDWTVNAGYRPVALNSFYPGNRWVDTIGVDAYDSYPSSVRPADRVRALFSEPDGLWRVRQFAKRHHKPLSIPEWGIGPAGQVGAAGDDPGYVQALAAVARRPGTLYQSYFAAGTEGPELLAAPRSRMAYVDAFGHK